jgi:peroxiredoxin
MDTTRKIVLATSAAAVGALLGSALWYGVVPPIAATSKEPVSQSSPAPEAGSTEVARKPSPAALEAFDALSKRVQSELKGAGDRAEAATAAIADFEAFIKKFPDDPASDRAALSLGNMQLLAGDAPAAMKTFEAVSKRPRDPEIAPLAMLFLGRAQAEAGQVEAARATLEALAAKEKDSRYGQAARQALGEQATRPGQRPPSFLMRDLTGRSQSPELYAGKVLLLDFWATWCGPCVAEVPNLKSLRDRFQKRGLAILGISLDTEMEALKRFIADEEIDWPQLCDGRGAKGELPRRMGVIAIPTMILIDRQGVIRHVGLRGEELEAAIEKLLAEPAKP